MAASSASVDTTIPSTCTFLHDHNNNDAADTTTESSPYLLYPEKFQEILATVAGIKDCAAWQIKSLETELDSQLLVEEKETKQEECNTAPTTLSILEDALDDGFVICDLEVVAQKLVAWRQLFPRIKPFFALKCNPDPMVAAVLGQTNRAAGFDCASFSEITLALSSTTAGNGGGNPNLLVYANPQRAEHDLEESLRLGVTAFTFDGEEELHKIARAYQKQQTSMSTPPQMILRLLVPDEHSSVPLGEKFGASPLRDRVQSLTQLSMHLELPIVGVSFHCGSGCHDPEAYVNAIRLAKDAMKMIDEVQQETDIPKCWLLDIGGGYPGRDGYSDVGRFSGTACTRTIDDHSSGNESSSLETAAKIAIAINPVLDELFPPSPSNANNGSNHRPVQIISEPGRYFVEEAFCLCSRIYRVERVEQSGGDSTMHYTIAQGVQGVFKDVLLCGETFHPIPLQLRNSTSATMAETQGALTETSSVAFPSVVHGPSGEDFDIVCKLDLPEMQVGDWLLFDRMGAYTLSISARSGRPPIRYVLGGCHRSPI